MTSRADFRLRSATPADHTWILPLAPRLHDFGPPPWRSRQRMDLAVSAAIERGLLERPSGSSVIVAEDPGGEPAGFVHLETATDFFTGEAHGHVSDLVVAPGSEGRGVGALLMAAAEAWAQEQGFRLLTLNVFGGNERALHLYQRLGFQADVTKMVKELP